MQRVTAAFVFATAGFGYAHAQTPKPLDLNHETVVRGLAAWRAPDSLTGAACVNCHTPDAFDLAYINFSDEKIRTRAAPHVSNEQADAIVDLVHHIRDHYGITEPKDKETFRPFQPGGEPLPTDVDSHSHRDAAFASYLEERAFPLTREGEYVSHPAQADDLIDELYSVDPRRVRMGMKLNRWSEDRLDGEEHGLIADWMSDQGRIPSSPEAADALYALQDEYLADPSWDRFWDYYLSARDLTSTPPGPGSAKLSTEKYLSAQIAQHLFRLDADGQPSFLDQPRMAFDTPDSPFWQDDRVFMIRLPNPIWEVGDGVRVFDGRDEFDYSGLTLLSINEDDFTWREQIEATRVPWFVAGWLFNPTLQRISGSNSTKSGEYLSDRGMRDFDGDIPTHISYVMHLKVVNHIMEERAVNKDRDIGSPKSWRPTLSNFTRMIKNAYRPDRRWGVDSPSNNVEFVDDRHEDAFVQFTINGHRMLLYRFRTELRERGVFTNLNPGDRGLGWMLEFMDKADPSGDHGRLFDEIHHLLSGVAYDPVDLDFDGSRTPSDIRIFIADFLRGDEHADLNADRSVDFSDIQSFVSAYFGSV